MNRAARRIAPGTIGALAWIGLALQVGPAQAQSSVSVYGNIDVAITKHTRSRVLHGRGYNNWLGFKGEEDLGGGVAATFHLETRFMPDTGALERESTFWQGESTVGLKSEAVGRLRFGRAMTPLWNSIWEYEPWYNSGFNGSLAAYQTGSFTSDGVFDAELGYANFSRISNGIFFDSATVSGFRLALAGQAERAPSAPRRNIGAALNYGKGGFKAMVGYERNQRGDTIHVLAASVAIGPLTLMGSRAHTDLVGNGRERVGVLAATYLLGTGTLRAGYGRKHGSRKDKLSVGYLYPLSKRTSLYADAYREEASPSITGYAIGMSHSF